MYRQVCATSWNALVTPADFTATRKTLGLSQTEMGKAIGLSLRMVRYYETGEYPIPKTVELALTAYANMRKER